MDQVIHGTFFGGSRIDRIRDVTLDSHGNIVVVGGTFSEDFPIHNAHQETYGGGELPPNEYLRFSGDGFVAKFTSDYDLIWSTYIGGTGFETAIHVEVNSDDDIIVLGQTISTDFPVTFGSSASESELGDPFMVFFTEDGELIESRIYIAEEIDTIQHVEKDPSGNIVIGGITSSTELYCTDDAFQNELAGDVDGFIRVISEDLETIIFSTYLGGIGRDFLGDIAVGHDGSIYASGSTSSADFPVTENVLRSELNDEEADSFLVKISPDRDLVTSTFIGGSDVDHVFGLTEGPDSSIVFVGRTWSPDFPVTSDAFQLEYSNVEVDGFLTLITDTGDDVLYSTYYGRDGWDSLLQVNMDEESNLLITGFVVFGGFETVNAFQPDYNDQSEIVLIIMGDEIDLISYLGGYGQEHPFAQVVQDGKIYVVGDTDSSHFMVSEDAYQTTIGGDLDGFLWVMDYDAYFSGDLTLEPSGFDYRPYFSYGIVLGAILVWFLYMRKTFQES